MTVDGAAEAIRLVEDNLRAAFTGPVVDCGPGKARDLEWAAVWWGDGSSLLALDVLTSADPAYGPVTPAAVDRAFAALLYVLDDYRMVASDWVGTPGSGLVSYARKQVERLTGYVGVLAEPERSACWPLASEDMRSEMLLALVTA